ncbi:type ISP restriction/modification enzyme [Hyphomonas sp.]|uniref:DEAD/DEAH box helicase n=1 Tax=Hyphomonas sp. TaxID=87 RepID=UPI000DF9115C|nr:type ISP restriction/modification enzyme [Hyphomonas sp.]RCL90161.1 MAG: damage-inducible protein [Hyphomonas sp.]
MTLREILQRYRDQAQNERDKGTAFEHLASAYFRHDPLQSDEYDGVWTFQEWAVDQGVDGKDTGIDLVAKIAGEDGFCAIQCKFYDENYRIQRGDLDSFFAASGKKQFTRRIVVDSTNGDWGTNAQDLLLDQSPPVYRIGLTDLEDSPIDWSRFLFKQELVLAAKKTLRPHQAHALEAVRNGLTGADRGKLIMACGTGKTFTGLKIAEDLAGPGKRVLFMVPSLSLMSQTVREWTNDAEVDLRSFAVCSDAQVGKRGEEGDFADIASYDLAYPATTDPEKLAEKVKLARDDEMTVVFSTYHSIDTISKAQLWHDLADFDLIICDEAHRTTGAKFQDEEESNFIKIHSDDNVRGAKRLYMTATPRVYGEGVKEKADEASVELCSMDNEELYGKTLFTRGFSWAVENGLLTDYKVIVLAVDEETVAENVQRRLTEGTELKLDDATKIIGCYKALTKQDLSEDLIIDPLPMKRALAFCKDIKTSKLVTNQFAQVVDEFLDSEEEQTGEEESRLRCELEHVDGTFNAKKREHLLKWLKADNESSCRILSNARCLSEGVDVPALDAILFLHPRKSQIDVVQSVGRVMRTAEGKKMGYVILPVAIPAGVKPEDALNDNERYKVVWQILNALRSHDERMDATINRIGFGEKVNDKIEIVAVTNKVPSRREAQPESAGLGQGSSRDDDDSPEISKPVPEPEQYSLWVDEFAAAIRAKIVKKCGTKDYWDRWAGSIADIAHKHITRINGTLKKGDTPERKAFDDFLEELRDDLNPSISEDEAVEMLAQHLITKPVFDAIFSDHSFTSSNPVSQALERVLGAIHGDSMKAEREELEQFYDSVRRRAATLQTAEAKQKVIVQLYDSFFRNAFPRMTEKLGIVYTPVEIVDFILHSVNEMLQEHFGQTLGSKGVHIMDPFTGTGTFITRLLQSGLIAPEELEHKYRYEIHANEIVLLAYYIAAINIEAVYQGETKKNEYVPFEGICLTDTFQMYEGDDELALYMPDNSERRTRQKELDIRVIVGNPPYSSGQNSANDHAANTAYAQLDERLRDTFVARSQNPNKRALYDSYIRAVRWASDRIGDAGIVAYVTNAGWIEGTATDGLRACLADEFSDLYVFHLRGNANTSGERRRKEKGNVFGEGSRAPIAVSVLVKNPAATEHGRIFFHDIGDYLDQKQKLAIIRDYSSINGIGQAKGWTRITPNAQHDWLNQRDSSFDAFIKIGDKRDKSSDLLFHTYSRGIATARDAWVYNASPSYLAEVVTASINAFNNGQEKGRSVKAVEGFKWCENTIKDYEAGKKLVFKPEKIVRATYRPFFKEWLYYDKSLNWSAYRMPVIFPDASATNRMIVIEGSWRQNGNLAMMCDSIHALMPDGGCQCFPLYLYDQQDEEPGGLFEGQSSGLQRRDAITDAGLAHFQAAYPGEDITKEDIFYYVYGLLHSPDYRDRYADNLTKELPRIPAVKTYADFRVFSDAGRRLGDLHVNYETVEPYPVTYKQGDLRLATIDDPEKFFRVEKMKFAGKRPNQDKATVVYNGNITMENIPLEAYDYIVNGKPALEWVMERQVVKTDKASGIVNDANDYANETMNDPAYPLELFQRVITVSLETMKIVNSLPKLDLPEN